MQILVLSAKSQTVGINVSRLSNEIKFNKKKTFQSLDFNIEEMIGENSRERHRSIILKIARFSSPRYILTPRRSGSLRPIRTNIVAMGTNVVVFFDWSSA